MTRCIHSITQYIFSGITGFPLHSKWPPPHQRGEASLQR